MRFCIVGTGRCGSKLLATTLHDHPDIGVFNETHWIPKMYEFYGTNQAHWKDFLNIAERTTWIGGECLLDVNYRNSMHACYDDFYDLFISNLSAKQQHTIASFSSTLACTLWPEKRFWADKTPDYGYYMQQIQTIWPECKFIHLVRQRYSTAESMSRHPGFQLMVSGGHDNWCPLSFDHLYKNLEIRPVEMGDFERYYERRIARIRNESSRLYEKSYTEINYEDLISFPEKILSSVCEYLEIEYSESWCRRFKHRLR